MQNLIKLQSYIPQHLSGLRLDLALAQLFPDYSRARIQQWIQAGKVLVDGQSKRSKDKVNYGQLIVLDVELISAETWQPQEIPLTIIFEDDQLIVIDKPAGLVVHPGAGNPAGTLVNALLHYAPELAQLPRAGIVHRLDKDTSGLLVIARTLKAHHDLVKQLQARQIRREYHTIVLGNLMTSGTISAPIARHPSLRTRMAVVTSGKPATTHYRILERFRAHTYLQVLLETGRTHQIRVHMTYIKHPLIGDPAYGKGLKLPSNASAKLATQLQGFKRQALHARALTLLHPRTQQVLSWETPIPEDMALLLEALRQDTLEFNKK